MIKKICVFCFIAKVLIGLVLSNAFYFTRGLIGIGQLFGINLKKWLIITNTLDIVSFCEIRISTSLDIVANMCCYQQTLCKAVSIFVLSYFVDENTQTHLWTFGRAIIISKLKRMDFIMPRTCSNVFRQEIDSFQILVW